MTSKTSTTTLLDSLTAVHTIPQCWKKTTSERSSYKLVSPRLNNVYFIFFYQRISHLIPQSIAPFSRRKSVTSWRGQKSVVSVVSCRFPNAITTTCCQLVADLLAVSLTSPQQVGNFPVYGEVTGKTCVIDFGQYCSTRNNYNVLFAEGESG